MRRPITWLDVFTKVPLTGNGLAVVHDADGVDDETMLAFARETRLSETTFVQTPTAAADYRNRIWTMAGEIAFAGHPSLGTAVAVAHARGMSSASFRQQTRAGLQPVDVQLDGDRARASMLQEPPTFGPRPAVDEVMRAAGLEPGSADPDLRPQVVSTGIAQLIAPVRATALADAAPPHRVALQALLESHDALVLYLVAVEPGGATARARGFFLDPAGIIEDPATGSAAGPLLAYLREYAGTQALTVRQGDEIGRPSVIDCSWHDDRPRIAGDVVIVAEGRVSLS